MALDFGALTSDRVDHGSGASMDDLDPYTFMCWVFPTAFSNVRAFFQKGDPSRRLMVLGTAGNLRVLLARATTDTDYRTSGNPMSLNAWNFCASAVDSSESAGNVVHIYVGSLNAEAVETTYSLKTDGEGAIDSDAGDNFFLGNRPANHTLSFQGRIAVAAYDNSFLTLAQIRSWQFKPRNLPSTVLYTHPGFNGTGAQPDLSGKGNNGTVTGATVANHVPLGPVFGFDHEWQGITVPAAVGTILPQVMQHGLYAGSAA